MREERSMDAATVEQTITEIDVFVDADSEISYHRVGRAGVVRIEATTKPGLHCDIPYVRVWGESLPSFGGEYVMAEYCQHNIIGVHYAKPVSA